MHLYSVHTTVLTSLHDKSAREQDAKVIVGQRSDRNVSFMANA